MGLQRCADSVDIQGEVILWDWPAAQQSIKNSYIQNHSKSIRYDLLYFLNRFFQDLTTLNTAYFL